MSVTLFDEAVLANVADLKDIDDTPIIEDKKIEASLESFAIQPNIEISNEDHPTPTPQGKGVPPIVQYTISPLPSGTGKMVTFYLNVPDLSSRIVNQFVMLSDVLVKYTDVLVVHLNSILEVDDSYVLHNALLSANPKAKIAVIPYALNTAAFYPALACNFIMPSKFGLVKFDACSVRAGGIGHLDAKNAYEFDLGRKQHLLNAMCDAGFLPQEDLTRILEKQGSYALYGDRLQEAIMRYNKRKKTV